jgi:hypothetical protein
MNCVFAKWKFPQQILIILKCCTCVRFKTFVPFVDDGIVTRHEFDQYYTQVRPKIKFCLFPLFDRPTKITATQKILLSHFMKNDFLKIFFHSYYTWTWWMYVITLFKNIDQQTSTLVKNIAYEWSLLSAILIIEGKNKIFLIHIGQIVESERGNKHFNLGLILNISFNKSFHLLNFVSDHSVVILSVHCYSGFSVHAEALFSYCISFLQLIHHLNTHHGWKHMYSLFVFQK